MAHNETLLVNGMEMNVRMFDHSAQEIDAAVGRALPNGAIDQAVGTFIRPNLLDNGYFGNPVDQRGGKIVFQGTMAYRDAGCTIEAGGVSEPVMPVYKVSDQVYAFTGGDTNTYYVKAADVVRGYPSNVYTVDRWWVESGMTLKIANDGVVLESAGTDWWAGLLEKKECSLPARTTITFSVLGKFTGDTQLFLGTGGNDELKSNYFPPSGDWECVSVTATLESATNMLAVRVSPDTKNVKANCTLLAAKLELGPTQTLAHREGDKWILNEVPDYGEQLRRCQRYCRVYKAGESLPCLAYAESNGWYLSASMYIGNMRTTPINNLGSGLSCSVRNIDADASFDKTIVNWGTVGSTIQRLRISGGDTTPGPFPYNVMPKQDLIFSADL